MVNTRKDHKKSTSDSQDIPTQNTFAVLTVPDDDGDNELPFQTLLDSLAEGKTIKPRDLGLVLTELLQQKQEISKLKDDVRSLRDENSLLQLKIGIHEGRIDHAEKDADKSMDRMVDMQGRMMANNIIIGKLPESGPNENTIDLVSRFFWFDLGLRQPVDISIAHRYGRKGKDPRPIVVSFVRRTDKLLVLAQGPALARSNTWMSEQGPDEIRTDQNILFKKKRAVIDATPALKGKIQVVGTKLMVDGAEKEDTRKIKSTCLDRKFDTTSEAMRMDPTSGTLTTVENSVFRAHFVPMSCPGQLKAALASIYTQDGAGKASHNSWAMRVNGKEGVHDDGESGAARVILSVMEERGVDNAIVIVTRWYGGRHIYNRRFETIKTLTEEVLNMVM